MSDDQPHDQHSRPLDKPAHDPAEYSRRHLLSAVGGTSLLTITDRSPVQPDTAATAATTQLTASPPATTWTQTYGGTDYDQFRSVRETSDGGYLAAGQTYSSGAGKGDGWLVKVGSDGAEQWTQTYGGGEYQSFWSVIELSDGGYLAAGETDSKGWLVKVGGDGTEQWTQTYGGTDTDRFESALEASDGGYLAAGGTDSKGWLVKVGSDGTEQWTQTYGGTGYDGLSSVIELSDGGYLTAGFTGSSGAGKQDGWLVKVGSDGTEQWTQTYGGTGNDRLFSVIEPSDGEYLAAGAAASSDIGNGWLVKVGSDGTEQWTQTYDRSEADWFRSVIELSDGGYLTAGDTESSGANDGWLVKVGGGSQTQQPTAAFTYPADTDGDGNPNPPEVSTAIPFDASPSSDADGTITAYEWDFDGDGNFETTGQQVTHTFDTVGDHTVTLRITDDAGTTATTQQTLNVQLTGTEDKLQLAQTIDTNSTMARLNPVVEEDISDRTDVQATIQALRDAVIDGTIDQAVAHDAIRRLRYAEQGTLDIVNRLGPNPEAGANRNMMFARQAAQSILGFGFDLLITFLTIKAGAALAGTSFLAQTVGTSVLAFFEDAVTHWFDELLGSAADTAKQQCRTKAEGIITRIREGTLATVSEIQTALDDAVSELVDAYTDVFRGMVELARADALFEFFETLLSYPSLSTLGRGQALYGGLRELSDAFSPSAVRGGLQGSMSTARDEIQIGQQRLINSLTDTYDTLQQIDRLASEINLADAMLDIYAAEDSSAAKQFLESLASVIDTLLNGAIGIVLNGTASLSAFIMFTIIKQTHGTMIDAARTGQEVSYLYV